MRASRWIGTALLGALLALALCVPTRLSASEVLQGTVVAVADGDTLTLLDAQGLRQRVRLAAIDAPERDQPFGRASGIALSELCLDIEAIVSVADVDRFGRTIGTVFCAGINANAELVQRGLAWVYVGYAPLNSVLFVPQDKARASGRGLWAERDAIAPWEWRRGQRAPVQQQAEPHH